MSLVGLEATALALRREHIDEKQGDIEMLLEDFDRSLKCAEQAYKLSLLPFPPSLLNLLSILPIPLLFSNAL